MTLTALFFFLAAIYFRPGEVIAGWEGLPFVAVAEVIGLIVVGVSWLFRPRALFNEPQDLYVFGFLAVAVASNPLHGWMYGGVAAFNLIFNAVVGYILVRAAVRKPKHLRLIGYALAAFTLFQAISGIQQYRTGVGIGDVRAFEQRVVTGEVSDGTEQPESIARIRGTGLFNDPNDLALAFVCVAPFLIGPILARRGSLASRFLCFAVLLPIVIALFLTNSRGGMIGFLAALTPYVWRSRSFFRKALVVAAVLVVIVLAPSRMASAVDSNEDSAQGRIQSWSAGLQMLKQNPVVGVGFGLYADYHELVAHNSFIHTIGELGLLGGFFFTGMFYWLFRGLLTGTTLVKADGEWAALTTITPDLLGACIGLTVCMVFLSRQYTVVPFLLLALGASYRSLLAASGVQMARGAEVKEIGAVVVMLGTGVVAYYVLVRALAVWVG